MGEYPAFGSIPRLHREITISEKIDGTNALVCISDGYLAYDQQSDVLPPRLDVALPGDVEYIAAGSRNRWLQLDQDNFGFAAWVQQNAHALATILGPGMHYGEWWGSGIQRGYGLEKGEKRFSLFNTFRWKDADFSAVPGLGVVPVLSQYTGAYMNEAVSEALGRLELIGSVAAPGFMRPEGVVVYHHAAKQYFKATIEKDEEPKSLRNGKAVA